MRKYIIFICLGLLPFVTRLQAQQVIKTTGYSITAIVQKNNGRIQLKGSPGDSTSYSYTDYNKSFVTFKVNNKYYTKTHVGFSPVPVNVSILNTGTVVKTGDTVKTVWTTLENVDLIQDVYPVHLYEYSWVIVMKWSAINKSSSSRTLGVQYLLNTVGGSNGDGIDRVLTKYGYDNSWRQYTNIGDTMPWSYYVSNYDLVNASYTSPSFSPGPGPITQGIFYDKSYKLKLLKPTRVTIGDWDILKKEIWGPKLPLPLTTGADLSTLSEWNTTTLEAGMSIELGRTAFARPQYNRCYAPTIGISFHPMYYTRETRSIINDTVLFEMFLFDQQNDIYGSPTLSMNVESNLKILSPNPIQNLGKSQTQGLFPDSLPRGQVTYASWVLKVDTVGITDHEIIAPIKISGRSNSHQTGFFTAGTDNDTCAEFMIIRTDDWKADTLAPLFTTLPPIDSSTRRISFSEMGAFDLGLKSISWAFAVPSESSNFIIIPQPIVGTCMKGIDTVTIFQMDTTKGGCINFVAIDCAGNKTEMTYCVPGKVFVPVDTIPPVIVSRTTKDKLTKEIVVSDPVENSSKIGTVLNQPLPTLPSFNQNVLFNSNCTVFGGRITVQRIDSLQEGCVYYTISDCAGNTMVDSICFVADTTLGVTENQVENIFSILGNPSSGRATIQLTLKKAQDVTLRIVDALGREVRRLEMKGLSQGENLIPLQTSNLASGTYFVIVEIDGKQFMKSLKVV